MTSAYSINLNFNNTIPVKTDFTFKQGDKGITLNLATTGLDTTGTTAHIVFKRSNGTSVEAELTGQTGPSYSYTILGNEFEIPGVVVADLKLYNGDTQRVSTASFIFLVTGDTMDGVGGGTGGYSDQLEQLSQEFAETLEEYQDAFGDVGAINPRGEYSALEEYTALDLVSYNGNSYLCREGCTGIAPTNTTDGQGFASGGGGTDDYEDLENKPSINGVELSGDKSTGDLGIEFNDLDDVDMTGVTDGQVPTWDATAGKYKPGGSKGTNPNLLINPWFTVNQRGSNSYTTHNTYTVDLWTIQGSNTTLAVSSSGISLSRSDSTAPKIQQIFENNPFEGQTVTVSAKLQNGTIVSETGVAPSTTEEKTFVLSSSISVVLGLYQGTAYVQIIGAASNTLSLRAIKLEIGSTSTLHLDTAPDYTTELLKCQRYCYVVDSIANAGIALGSANASTTCFFLMPLPVKMRTNTPTLTYTGASNIIQGGSAYAVTGITIGLCTNYQVQFIASSSGLTVNALGFLKGGAGGCKIVISAEL